MQGESDLCDYLKQNFQIANRNQYLKLIRQTISQQQSPPAQELDPMVEQYYSEYRNFMHTYNFTANSKANALIEEALNNVHPGLKTKKQCKVILSIVAKVFCQELIEQCVEVKEEYKKPLEPTTNPAENNMVSEKEAPVKKNNEKHANGEIIDIDVLEQAYRRRMLKREKI